MRKEYDFSDGVKNPYVRAGKSQPCPGTAQTTANIDKQTAWQDMNRDGIEAIKKY